jgi:hypothetical protein
LDANLRCAVFTILISCYQIWGFPFWIFPSVKS